MKLEFKILGVALASIELHLPTGNESAAAAVETAVGATLDSGVKLMSRHWLNRLGRSMK